MAMIYQLRFCGTCRKPIREDDSYIRWEKEIYYEPYCSFTLIRNIRKKLFCYDKIQATNW